jgi:hypothetical protein
MFTQGLLRNQPADLWKGHICSISIESVESVVGEIGCATIIERIAWISLDEVLEKIEEVLACDVEVVLVEPPIYASVLSVLDVLDEYSFVCCEDGSSRPPQGTAVDWWIDRVAASCAAVLKKSSPLIRCLLASWNIYRTAHP